MNKYIIEMAELTDLIVLTPDMNTRLIEKLACVP